MLPLQNETPQSRQYAEHFKNGLLQFALSPWLMCCGMLDDMVISPSILCMMTVLEASIEMKGAEKKETVVTPFLLDEIVRRIVESVQPLLIVLFGSAARGDMGANSDLDILIVMPDGAHRRQTAVLAYRALRGIGLPKDIVVVTKSDVIEHRDNPSLVIKPALDEGRAIYGERAGIGC